MNVEPNQKKIYFSESTIELLLLTWLSLIVHFWRINYPNSIVFDEVTFGKFLNSYARGEYYFDLHPPLGKLLFGWISQWGGINAQFNYDKIGSVFTEDTYIWLRSLTAFWGALIPIFVALFLRGLGFSRWVVIVSALFLIFENALVVLSRTFVFDIFLPAFGFASLAALVWYYKSQWKILWWLAWIFAVAAFSIKWTGLSFLGVITLLEWRRGLQQKSGWVWIRKLIVGWSLSLALYFLVFAVHFAWTPRSGMGNDFMSPEFQSGLIGNRFFGNPSYVRPSLWGQFVELNQMMWSYQKSMNQGHPYSSQWYSWPWMARPIYFWGNTGGLLKERIYLLGNPILWWLSTLAILVFIFQTWKKFREWWREPLDSPAAREFSLLVLFVVNYLPFVAIGRVMFIYHYMSALIIALVVLALSLEKWAPRKWALAFVGLSILMFCYFAPLTYALPLSDTEYEWRLWFSTWL